MVASGGAAHDCEQREQACRSDAASASETRVDARFSPAQHQHQPARPRARFPRPPCARDRQTKAQDSRQLANIRWRAQEGCRSAVPRWPVNGLRRALCDSRGHAESQPARIHYHPSAHRTHEEPTKNQPFTSLDRLLDETLARSPSGDGPRFVSLPICARRRCMDFSDDVACAFDEALAAGSVRFFSVTIRRQVGIGKRAATLSRIQAGVEPRIEPAAPQRSGPSCSRYCANEPRTSLR